MRADHGAMLQALMLNSPARCTGPTQELLLKLKGCASETRTMVAPRIDSAEDMRPPYGAVAT